MITIPGRIPIYIHPIFWVLILVIGWLNSSSSGSFNEQILTTAIWAVIILFSVLIHEYGHALTALAFGQQARIELVGLGGVTYRQGKKLKLWQDFIVVLNGPLAGFMLFLAAGIFKQQIGESDTIISYVIFITMWANLFWTILNLVPVHPLDGGRLLSIIMEGIFGLKGLRFSFLISGILAVLISFFFFSLHAILGGAIFLMLAFESYRAWSGSRHMTKQDQDDTLQAKMKKAEESLRFEHREEAKKQFEEIREETKEGETFIAASEYLASIYAKEERWHEVYEMLNPFRKELKPEAMQLLHNAAFHSKKLHETIKFGDSVYQVYPNYEIALTNALSYALLKDVTPAVGWLKRSITDGLPNVKSVLNRKEFDLIRHTEPFRELENHVDS